MSAKEYAKTLSGLSLNLIVKDVGEAVRFATLVLDAQKIYADPDFAVVQAHQMQWMLHADHCYDQHPMAARLAAKGPRGCGLEIRLHGLDPDRATSRASEFGYTVLIGAQDKRHGVREAYLIDRDGYVWVPDILI
jgi:uncharacterized glyoxalase superfamily protein PhnB